MRPQFHALFLCAVVAGPASGLDLLALDDTKTFQTIRHFGASAAWWAQDVGAWPRDRVEAIMDALFDREKGIGLGIIRYNLGGGKDAAGSADPWRSAESPLSEDGTLDWERDGAAVGIVDEAVRRGASVILFANSPPAAMTVTRSPEGNGKKANLRPDSRAAFAAYLADCVESLERTRSWPIAAVSPMNEPQWDWGPGKGQEGSHYGPEGARALLEALSLEFTARGIDTPVSAPESGDWKAADNLGYLSLIWKDERLSGRLGHYSLHSYWSSRADRERLSRMVARDHPGLEIWQTEWTEMRAGRDAGMDSALSLARTVHEDLVSGGVSSWQYWIAVSKYDYRDGLLYADPASRSFQRTKRLWALGNYSRFIDRGARRIGCAAKAARGISASAYRNPDGSLVCVVVNGDGKGSGPFELSVPGRAFRLELWETSAARDLERVYSGPPRAVAFPGRSVTTLVFRE
jgi:O-glycosyl hydrolase